MVNPLSYQSFLTLTSSLSSLYCLLLLSSYTIVTVNNFTNLPVFSHEKVEVGHLLTYLLTVSCMFLLLILTWLGHPPRARLAKHSHGSAFLRQGAAVFGLGTIVYYLIEIAALYINYECVDGMRIVNGFLALLFIILQSLTVLLQPRLLFNQLRGLPHFVLMHLVATNLILWVRTVIKESLLEVDEAMEREHEHEHEHEHEETIGTAEHFAQELLINHTHCPESDSTFMSSVVRESSPILFAFIIEFVLIGATMFFNTWQAVGTAQSDDQEPPKKTLQRPRPRQLVRKTDWSHSSRGFVLGLIFLLFNIIALIIFFSVASAKDTVDEYLEKITRCVTNSYGLLACILGILQIQRLGDKEEKENNGVDVLLLNLSSFFCFIYMSFTVSVGLYTQEIDDVPPSLHISNGIIDILQVSVQVIFIKMLLEKTPSEGSITHPGRQVTTFLILLNMTLWLVDTFELQKARASLVEASFYGPLTWVFLQRVTLPLCIFFRFHSTVVLIDCWKNSYYVEERTDKDMLELKRKLPSEHN